MLCLTPHETTTATQDYEVHTMIRWGMIATLVFTAGLARADEEKESPSLRWEENIQAFEKQDGEQPVAPGGVLFVGSSSIRMWDLAHWFPDLPTLNRGFGGSEIADSIYYFDRVVAPYKPAAIVFYAGDNDIAKGKTAESVFEHYKTFAARVHEALPEATLLFVGIKPSVSRWRLYPEMKKANELIRAHTEGQEREIFIDVEGPTTDDKGNPRKDLLLDDGLHLNEAGYEIWAGLVKGPLEELLAPKADSPAEESDAAPSETPAATPAE